MVHCGMPIFPTSTEDRVDKTKGCVREWGTENKQHSLDIPISHVAVLNKVIHFVDRPISFEVELSSFVHLYPPLSPVLFTTLLLRRTVSCNTVDAVDGCNIATTCRLEAG